VKLRKLNVSECREVANGNGECITLISANAWQAKIKIATPEMLTFGIGGKYKVACAAKCATKFVQAAPSLLIKML